MPLATTKLPSQIAPTMRTSALSKGALAQGQRFTSTRPATQSTTRTRPMHSESEHADEGQDDAEGQLPFDGPLTLNDRVRHCIVSELHQWLLDLEEDIYNAEQAGI